MSKSLATHTAETLRLRVLRTLQNAVAYTADLNLLCDHLVVGLTTLVGEIQWLEDHGLVEMDQVDGVTTVRLTRLGQDVATGRERLSGVRRPDPI